MGRLTGFCYGAALIGIGNNNGSLKGEMHYKPIISDFSNCHCMDHLMDAGCGPEVCGGITCPFDSRLCRSKCCRQGRSGGHCSGFLWLKCKCD